MNEERRVFRNTAILALATLIDRAGSVFLIFVLSRALHTAGLGVYSATIAVYGLLTLAAEVGAPHFLVREIAQDKSRTGRYLLHLSLLAMLGGFIAITLAAFVIPHIGYSPELRTCVSVALLAVIPGILNALHEAVFVAHQRVELQAYTTLITASFSLFTSVYLLLQGFSVLSLIIVFVTTKYAITICYLFCTTRYITSLRERIDLSFAWSLLYEMRAFAASSLLAGFFARPEILFLSLRTSETQIGLYTAALKLVELWLLLPETYMTNVFPLLTRSYHIADHNAQQIQERAIRYLLAVALPVAVGLVIAATPIIHLFYGPNFTDSVPILQMLACGLPFYFLNSVLWRVLVARGQQNLNVRAQMITLPSRLASGALLIVLFGAFGAAIATISNILFHNRLLSVYIQRAGTHLRVFQLVWRFALVAFLMGAVVFLYYDVLSLGLLVPLAIIVYLSLILCVRAFSPEELAAFHQLFQANTVGKHPQER